LLIWSGKKEILCFWKSEILLPRTVSRCGRNENARLAAIPHDHKVSGIKNNLVPKLFPEIKSPEVRGWPPQNNMINL
jgi:hypothetical protein